MTGASMEQLEIRLQHLEDRMALAELTARYALAVNQGWCGEVLDVASLPEVFAPDAQWCSRAMGVHVQGLDAIIAGAERGTRATNFAMHCYANPIIDLNGDFASARWLLYVASRRHAGPANLVFMEDIIAYARHPEGWRIRSVERRFGMELVKGASSHDRDDDMQRIVQTTAIGALTR